MTIEQLKETIYSDICGKIADANTRRFLMEDIAEHIDSYAAKQEKESEKIPENCYHFLKSGKCWHEIGFGGNCCNLCPKYKGGGNGGQN
jgi:hypothetical protein